MDRRTLLYDFLVFSYYVSNVQVFAKGLLLGNLLFEQDRRIDIREL